MARADLLRRLFQSFQQRDEQAFRAAAAEIVEEERRKQHPVIASELERILRGATPNGSTEHASIATLAAIDGLPTDADRRSALVDVRQPRRYLEDLVLSKDIRALLDRVLREFSGWDVLEANGLEPVRRVLFCGPSGCGKTVTAEALASELGLPLLYVRFDSVVSSLLGETAANLRKVFDYARRGQWVVLFDEFDAIGRSRDDATEHGEIKRVVNSFLQLLDGFNGRSLVIAATNFEQALDPAIWRRFDDVIRFERPDRRGVREMVSKRLRPLPVTEAQVSKLAEALVSSTFADAERVCLDIRKACALGGQRQVHSAELEEALERHAYRRRLLGRASSQTAPVIDSE
jgi:SpoVK/Ycf46/Vps4 family AAA+-type ATPase